MLETTKRLLMLFGSVSAVTHYLASFNVWEKYDVWNSY